MGFLCECAGGGGILEHIVEQHMHLTILISSKGIWTSLTSFRKPMSGSFEPGFASRIAGRSRQHQTNSLVLGRAGKAGYPPLVGHMVELCKRHLASPGSSRDMAAKLLGRLLTRPDTGVALREYVRWCAEALGTDTMAAAFLVPGCLSELSSLYPGQLQTHPQPLPQANTRDVGSGVAL